MPEPKRLRRTFFYWWPFMTRTIHFLAMKIDITVAVSYSSRNSITGIGIAHEIIPVMHFFHGKTGWCDSTVPITREERLMIGSHGQVRSSGSDSCRRWRGWQKRESTLRVMHPVSVDAATAASAAFWRNWDRNRDWFLQWLWNRKRNVSDSTSDPISGFNCCRFV